MRRSFIIGAVLYLCASVAVTACAQDKIEGWRFTGSTKDDYVYFQVKSVRRTEQKTVKAWVRYKYKRSATEQRREYLNNQGGPDYFDAYKYGYILELQEFKCYERKSLVTSRLRYEDDGEYLGGTQRRNEDWIDVVPGSIGEIVLDAVCDFDYAVEHLMDDLPPVKPKPNVPRRARRTRH